jgi:hypothetical protein
MAPAPPFRCAQLEMILSEPALGHNWPSTSPRNPPGEEKTPKINVKAIKLMSSLMTDLYGSFTLTA